MGPTTRRKILSANLTLDPYVVNFQLHLGLSDVDPIVSIFGVCDAESDQKLSVNEILGNADCWNMLENAGMQNTSITDEFSMIDKDQDGYISMYEAYDAAQTLDRKGEKKKAPAPDTSIYGFNDINMFLKYSLKIPLK